MPETATDPLILAAEQADAEAAAAEAEALAAQASATAARARARAAKLRREAGEHQAAGSDTAAEPGADGSAAVPADSGVPGPALTANTTDTGAVADDSVTGDATRSASGTGRETSETVPAEAKTASLSKSPGSEPTAAPEDAGPGSTPAGDTATSPDPAADSLKTAGSGDDTKGPDSSKNADSDGDTATGRFAAARRRLTTTSTVRRPSRRAAARVLVAVIVFASLVTGGYSIWNHQQIAADQAREDEFLNAAREGVIALTTLDSGRAVDDVKRVLDHSTGAFRTDFQTRSEDFTKVVEQSKVATQGEITAAAVESMTDESAVVLVSAVSRVTNSAGAQQEPRVWRLSVTVTREGSEWKMSKVEFVP
ncbi:hypothetical protein [Nocardia carnea]|uniref:hypothetical protein n=1 Tax=Nocardia carnea TaxID=37328 RepID=UPI00245524A8|nr:hypothetical protein [Nocardia carnea]